MLMMLICERKHNIVGEDIDTIKKNTEALLDARKEVDVEVNQKKN
jgi:hypothetical protein